MFKPLPPGVAVRWGIGSALARLAPPPGRAVRVLTFHDVSPAAIPALHVLVDSLLRTGRILTPSEFVDVLEGRSDTGGFLISFDDAYQSCVGAIRQVLDPRGVRAVVFACPGLIDLPDDLQEQAILRNLCLGDLHHAFLPATPRFAGWDDLAGLAATGHEIGGHTTTHRRLAGLTAGELEAEVAGGHALARARLGLQARWFAFPFGDADDVDGPALRSVSRHFEMCCTAVRGPNLPSTSKLAIWRDDINLGLPLEYHQMILRGGFDLLYASRRRRFQRLTEQVRQRNPGDEGPARAGA